MAITAYRRVSFCPFDFDGGGNIGLSFSLNNTTNKWSAGFAPSEAFTLAKVAIYINTETGTSPQYRLRIETDSGGRPSGSLAWANATVNFTATTTGWQSLQTLTASGAVSIGTLYHLLCEPVGTPDASNFIAPRENGQMTLGAPAHSVGLIASWSNRYTGSWASGSGAPCFALGNSDDSYIVGQVCDTSNLYTITNTAWKGLKFVAPCAMTVWGCRFQKVNSTSAGAVALKLISSGNSVLATATLPDTYWDVNTSRGDKDLFVFDTPVALTAGNTYRIVAKDPSGNQRFDSPQCTSATLKVALPGIGTHMLTEGTSSDGTASPTSWTDSDDEMCYVELLGSSVASGGGTAGSRLVGPSALVTPGAAA